jgi:RsiW-degrading membrane proteinase PrsW (M82 family)
MDPTVLAWSIAAAVIPTVIYVVVLVLLDRHEKEPWTLMGMVFLWGAVPSIMLSMMFELVLAVQVRELVPREGANLVNVAVMAPVVEELAKALALLIVFWFARREFDGIMDGLLYGSLAGFGFAMTENVFYFHRAFAEDTGLGIQLVFMRAVVFGLNHALFCSMFGLGLGVARYGRNILIRGTAPLLGLAGAMILHMFHNYAVCAIGGVALSFVVMWLGVGMWLLLVYLALQQESKWIREELESEVAIGILTRYEVEATAEFSKRAILKLLALRHSRHNYAAALLRLHDLAAELAFKKRQFRIHGEEGDTVAEVESLREQIRELKAETEIAEGSRENAE